MPEQDRAVKGFARHQRRDCAQTGSRIEDESRSRLIVVRQRDARSVAADLGELAPDSGCRPTNSAEVYTH